MANPSAAAAFETAEHPHFARFDEDSALARADRRATACLARCGGGGIASSCLARLLAPPVFLFGHVFTTPLTALATLPPLLFAFPYYDGFPTAGSGDGKHNAGEDTGGSGGNAPLYVSLYAACATVTWLVVYAMGHKRVLGRPGLFLPQVVVTGCLLAWLDGPRYRLTHWVDDHGIHHRSPWNLYCVYLCGWIWSAVLAFLGKGFYLRARPAAQSAADNNNNRHENTDGGVHSAGAWASRLAADHAFGDNSRHSFPSFDAAGAGCAFAAIWAQELVYLLRVGEAGAWGTAGLFWHALSAVPWPIIAMLVLVCYGRIFFEAHHLLDVITGAALGMSCTLFVSLFRRDVLAGLWALGMVGEDDPAHPGSIPSSDSTVQGAAGMPVTPVAHWVDLVWVFVVVAIVGVFFVVKRVGPFVAVAIPAAAALLLPHVGWAAICMTSFIVFLYAIVFQVQSEAHKPWVVSTLGKFFRASGPAPPDELLSAPFPAHLETLLADKRAEFLAKTEEPGGFPGNLYVIQKFRGLGARKKRDEKSQQEKERRQKKDDDDRDNENEDQDVEEADATLYFVCTWARLDSLCARRLKHFFRETRTTPGDYDVLLGIYSGGALLAPLIQRQISEARTDTIPLEYIRCSRYDSCNMDPVSLSKVVLDITFGKHDDKYTIKQPPARVAIEGKSVLMVDDASISGGTFRAVANYLTTQLGATSVRGVALCSFNGISHIFDPQLKEGSIVAEKFDVGTFTPWGTF